MTQCKLGCEKLANGNCPTLTEDSLPAQCVGIWATDKHHYLREYIAATRAVRGKFIGPGKGGAAFIDLFAGPGVVRIRDTGATQDGSPLIALRHQAAPFSKLIFCEIEADNVGALHRRTSSDVTRVSIIEGDSNRNIDRITPWVPVYGLNIALIDPFALSALKFRTIEELAKFQRMDLIVHFPTGDIKRNLEQNPNSRQWLTEAVGTSSWQTRMTSMTDVGGLIELFKEQLSSLGYGSKAVPSEPIKNNQNLPLYYLVYASKHDRGDAIWKSITRNTPTGQRGLGF